MGITHDLHHEKDSRDSRLPISGAEEKATQKLGPDKKVSKENVQPGLPCSSIDNLQMLVPRQAHDLYHN